MSADNGIYILEAKDGWRVIHAQAIDNLNWWWTDERLYDKEFVEAQEKAGVKNPFKSKGESRNELNPREIAVYFGHAKVHKTKEAAMEAATKMYDEIMSSSFPIVEYGISFINGWEDKEFPYEFVNI